MIAKLLRCPSRSVNQSSTNSAFSFSTRRRTTLRESSFDVALFSVSTCAMFAS